jgi:hypothetical protein
MTRNNGDSKALQQEAESARYALRSSYYYRMYGIWGNLLELLADAEEPNWKSRGEWGISGTAWARVEQTGESPTHVFCNPSVITAEPRLITYYRCLALLPQKGIQRLAVNTATLEAGRGRLNSDRAISIAKTINNLVCTLIDSDHGWELEKSRVAAILNLGSQINGSWRNEIGNEGGRRVKQLLVAFAWQREAVASILLNDGSNVLPGELLDSQLVRELHLTNGVTVAFSSEPDVSVRDSEGNLIGTVEIKYGLDPAGALERYGAAKKSFEEATRENIRVSNVYLASCITPEVRRRISEDRLVNHEFNLTEVLNDGAKRDEFLNYMRRLLEP